MHIRNRHLGGFLIESGLQCMHGALEVGASAEVSDELRHSTHAGEGGNLQEARIIEAGDYAVVLIFVQQGFEYGAGLRAVLGEHIALAHVGHAIAAGERWLVEGDVADEIEGVQLFVDFFK
jgi:hypothetical protein